MEQRVVNALIFGFAGVLLGFVLAAVAGFASIEEVLFAVLITAGLGAIVGWSWKTPTHTARR